MKIPAHVRTIGALVHWIADTYHDGAVYPIAARTRLSPGILARWAGDSVKTPRLDSVVRFADAYQLNSQDVLTLVYRSLELDLARQRKLITNEIKRRRRPRAPPSPGAQGPLCPYPMRLSLTIFLLIGSTGGAELTRSVISALRSPCPAPRSAFDSFACGWCRPLASRSHFPRSMVTLHASFRMTGWRWPFRLGDVLEVWRDDELVGELSVELLTSMVVHYLVGHQLSRGFDASMLPALPPRRRPLVHLPQRAADPQGPLRAIYDASYRATLRARRRSRRHAK